MFLGRCALCIHDGSGGGSDSCDAVSCMRCHERRGREVLGTQSKWPGDASCFVFVLLSIFAFAILGEQPR